MDDSASDPAQASRAPLPNDPAAFDADERVSFSKLSEKFILEAEDGQEFEWEHSLKRWVPVVCDRPFSHGSATWKNGQWYLQ